MLSVTPRLNRYVIYEVPTELLISLSGWFDMAWKTAAGSKAVGGESRAAEATSALRITQREVDHRRHRSAQQSRELLEEICDLRRLS
jgi:hypothetical protein